MKKVWIIVLVIVAAAVVYTAVTLTRKPGTQQQDFTSVPRRQNNFMEQSKYTFQLMGMVRNIQEIDKDEKYALTSAQAKEVLDILKPLSQQPKLTQDEAKQVLRDLKRVLTEKQLNALARIKPGPRRGGPGQGMRPGSGQRPGGRGPGRDGADRPRRQFDPEAMKDFNPFYSNPEESSDNPMVQAKRWEAFFDSLEEKAKVSK